MVDLLFPANEQSPEAVHPGMGALDHPAPRPIARDLRLGLGVLATRAKVDGVATRF